MNDEVTQARVWLAFALGDLSAARAISVIRLVRDEFERRGVRTDDLKSR